MGGTKHKLPVWKKQMVEPYRYQDCSQQASFQKYFLTDKSTVFPLRGNSFCPKLPHVSTNDIYPCSKLKFSEKTGLTSSMKVLYDNFCLHRTTLLDQKYLVLLLIVWKSLTTVTQMDILFRKSPKVPA